MDISRNTPSKRQRSRDPLDRRVDKWIETGRQFVDGVAGTRPGQRKALNAVRASSSSLESVGRWVGDKLDWLLEEEEDWSEPWESVSEMSTSSSKRPLDAISKRVGNVRSSSSLEGPEGLLVDDQWPDDSSFRVDRWQRGQHDQNTDHESPSRVRRPSPRSERRPLPRSSRR